MYKKLYSSHFEILTYSSVIVKYIKIEIFADLLLNIQYILKCVLVQMHMYVIKKPSGIKVMYINYLRLTSITYNILTSPL